MAQSVKIVVDAIDNTKRGLTAPIKNVKELGAAVDALKPAFAAAAAAAVASFALIANAQVDVIEQTAKLSKKLGITTEDLSTMAHAAQISGASFEALKPAFKSLGQKAVDATRGLKSAIDDFDALGISVTDTNGRVKDSMQLFLEIADAMSGMENGLEKAGLASKIFGRQGLELVPLLNEGAAGVRKLQEEAKALGLEIGGNTAAASEEYVDNLTRMKAGVTGLVRSVLSEMLPAMVDATGSIVQWNRESGVFQGAAMTIVDGLEAVGRAGKGIAAIFKLLGSILGAEASHLVDVFKLIAAQFQIVFEGVKKSVEALGEAVKAAVNRDFDGAAAAVVSAGAEMRNSFAALGPEFAKQMGVIQANSAAAAEDAKAKARAIFDAFAGTGDNAASAGGATGSKPGTGTDFVPGVGNTEENSSKAAAYIDKIQSEFLRLTLSKEEFLRREQETEREVTRASIADFGQRLETMSQLAVVHQAQMDELRQEALAKEEEARSFLRSLEEQARLEEQTWLGEQRQIAEDDHIRNLERIAELAATEQQARELREAAVKAHNARLVKLSEEAAYREMAIRARVAGAWAGAFGAMGQVVNTFFGEQNAASKAFGITEAIINTYRAANQVLADPTLPYFAKVPAMIATIGQGLANVAAISGVAHGGISDVPSEQTFLLQKGERVLSPDQNEDFTNFIDQGGTGGGGTMHLKIYLDGRQLYEGIERASRDGRLTISPRAIG